MELDFKRKKENDSEIIFKIIDDTISETDELANINLSFDPDFEEQSTDFQQKQKMAPFEFS
jgi:hypothetical protein